VEQLVVQAVEKDYDDDAPPRPPAVSCFVIKVRTLPVLHVNTAEYYIKEIIGV